MGRSQETFNKKDVKNKKEKKNAHLVLHPKMTPIPPRQLLPLSVHFT